MRQRLDTGGEAIPTYVPEGYVWLVTSIAVLTQAQLSSCEWYLSDGAGVLIAGLEYAGGLSDNFTTLDSDQVLIYGDSLNYQNTCAGINTIRVSGKQLTIPTM